MIRSLEKASRAPKILDVPHWVVDAPKLMLNPAD
jgi:hypothetical protein